MGEVNQPSNLLDQVRDLQRQINEIRKTIGLSSAILRGGGLQLLDGAFLKQVDSAGQTRFFAGGSLTWPLAGGVPQPVVLAYDANNSLRLALYDPDPTGDGYQPVVWIYDHLGHVAFTTDKSGGVAEPWIPVPMYAKAFPTTFLDSTGTDLTLPVSACNGGTVWEGRIGKVSHPRIQYDFVGGRVTGSSGSPTYTFVVNGTVLDTVSFTGYGSNVRGPFDISSLLTQQNITVQLKVSATGTGTDRIACNMNGVWMRQTP